MEDNINVTPLITVCIDDKGKIYVEGAFEQKDLCIRAIAEVLKILANFRQKIVIPQ